MPRTMILLDLTPADFPEKCSFVKRNGVNVAPEKRPLCTFSQTDMEQVSTNIPNEKRTKVRGGCLPVYGLHR